MEKTATTQEVHRKDYPLEREVRGAIRKALVDGRAVGGLLWALGRHHRFSPRNRIALWFQDPGAQYVGTRTGWEALGGTIKEGAKGVRILGKNGELTFYTENEVEGVELPEPQPLKTRQALSRTLAQRLVEAGVPRRAASAIARGYYRLPPEEEFEAWPGEPWSLRRFLMEVGAIAGEVIRRVQEEELMGLLEVKERAETAG